MKKGREGKGLAGGGGCGPSSPTHTQTPQQVQQELERRTGKAESVFVDMSVSETIYNLIVLASDVAPGRAQEFLQEAAKVQKRFKVWCGRVAAGCLSRMCPSPSTHPPTHTHYRNNIKNKQKTRCPRSGFGTSRSRRWRPRASGSSCGSSPTRKSPPSGTSPLRR